MKSVLAWFMRLLRSPSRQQAQLDHQAKQLRKLQQDIQALKLERRALGQKPPK